jgi:hypothetical protein
MLEIDKLTQFKHILGKPNEGIHKYRFLNTAIIDYISTIILSGLTTYVFNIPIVLTTIFWMTLSTILHILFGVKTTTTKYLGIQ